MPPEPPPHPLLWRPLIPCTTIRVPSRKAAHVTFMRWKRRQRWIEDPRKAGVAPHRPSDPTGGARLAPATLHHPLHDLALRSSSTFSSIPPEATVCAVQHLGGRYYYNFPKMLSVATHASLARATTPSNAPARTRRPFPHPLASTPTETPAFVSTSQPDGPLYTPTGTPKPGQRDSVPAVSWLPLAVPGLQAVRGEANTCYAEQFRVRGSEVGPDQVRGCIT